MVNVVLCIHKSATQCLLCSYSVHIAILRGFDVQIGWLLLSMLDIDNMTHLKVLRKVDLSIVIQMRGYRITLDMECDLVCSQSVFGVYPRSIPFVSVFAFIYLIRENKGPLPIRE